MAFWIGCRPDRSPAASLRMRQRLPVSLASRSDVSQAQSAATNVLNLLDQVPEIDSLSDEGKQLGRDDVLGHIKFNNVHFRYPTRPGVRVLRNLSLEIKPGTVRPLACC
jgi:ABC-type multidrug transport system fused ATPase/permease subunit